VNALKVASLADSVQQAEHPGGGLRDVL